MEFSEALRALMDERGISQRGLASRIPCDRSLICRLCSGKQRPSVRIAQCCDQILGADGALVALAAKPQPTRRTVLAGVVAGLAGPPLFGLLDGDGRERLAWVRRYPRRIDDTTVRSLAEVLAAQRRAEDTLGSAALLAPVKAQLAAVEDLAAEARGPMRPAVIGIAEEWSQFAAWLHTNARDFPAARDLWRQTLELSTEADDATMTATVLRLRAYMAWLAGEPGPMIGLAQAAQRDRRAAVSQRACSASLEARGYAMTGDTHETERKLAESEDLAGQVDGQPAESWSYWWSPQWFECQRGLTLGYLAHISRYRTQAIEALATAYTDVTGSELAAGYLVHRAAIHTRGGDVAEACADAFQVVPIWRQTKSAGLRGLLVQLRTDLAARYPGDARVKELAEALA